MNLKDDRKFVNIIRSVHEKLRREVHLGESPDQVWERHLKEDQLRKSYAGAMFELATKYWNKNESRLYWCYGVIMEYFFHGGRLKSIEREMRVQAKKCASNMEGNSIANVSPSYENLNRKLILLDVGSCYNPFSKFKEFNCIPIDLTPATLDVYQCDFLNTNIYPNEDFKGNYVFDSNIIHLCEETFDIVIFSLVLEYLPTAKQRWIFCCKAWQLLNENGLLVLITPDSKSQLHNVPMVKSWRIGIESIGFKRFKYEKLPHFHCMAFRKLDKSSFKNNLSDNITNSIYIPQDFYEYSEVCEPVNRSDVEDQVVSSFFSELTNEVELF